MGRRLSTESIISVAPPPAEISPFRLAQINTLAGSLVTSLEFHQVENGPEVMADCERQGHEALDQAGNLSAPERRAFNAATVEIISDRLFYRSNRR